MSKLRRFLSSARLYAAALLLGLAVWLTPERGGHKKRLLEQLIPYLEGLLDWYGYKPPRSEPPVRSQETTETERMQ